MSALRISRPGIPGTTLIDLGPASARMYGGGYGGVMVSAAPPQPRGENMVSEHRRQQLVAAQSRHRERQLAKRGEAA